MLFVSEVVLKSRSNICNSLALLSSYMEWQHLVGVVQRNQPCLHGHPMCRMEFKVWFLFTIRRSSRWPQ